ncbi:hypothetical protein KAR48_17485 [bacterium]|nr:hypothetical protein [bacterium]
MKMFRLFCLTLVLVVLVLPIMADDGNVAALLRQGDTASDSSDYTNAAVAYINVLKIDSLHYEALWKTGDMYTELADLLSDKEKNQKEIYFNKAEEYCLKAIVVQQEGWEGHAKLSVVYGRLGLFRGGKEKVKIAQKVRFEAEKAVELNPDCALAMHVLGRWHQNVADLSGIMKFFAKKLFGEELKGSHAQAAQWFTKAAVIEPDILRHPYQLGVSYKKIKQNDKARTALETAITLIPEDSEEQGFMEEARKMLKKLK